MNISSETRPQVLSLYRKILRLARKWQTYSKSLDDARKESAYIYKEAQTLFRANANLIDSLEIKNHIREAEARIELALHYGTPYPRLVNVPHDTIAPHIFQSKSKSRSGSSATHISKRTERAIKESIPSYLKSYSPKGGTNG